MPAHQTYCTPCYSSGASADMSKFCDKVPPDAPPTGISQQCANEVENFKHNRICLIDSDAPSHWLKTKFFVDTYAPLSSTYRPEFRFRNAMQAMTVNQKANKDAETMFTYFNQVGSITNANIDAINSDLAQIKADAESAAAPEKAESDHSESADLEKADNKVFNLLGIDKAILPEWMLSKLAKVIDQLLSEERKAKQLLAEGDNDTDMSSAKGASTTSESIPPKKKVRTTTPPPGGPTTTSKSKPKSPQHTIFSSDDENEKMKVANAVAKIENAADRRRAAKEARLAGQEKVKKNGKAKR